MIEFSSFSLPTLSGDFLPSGGSEHPCFTIYAQWDPEDGISPAVAGVFINDDIGWVDIYLDGVGVIDEDTARRAIAGHLGLPCDHISIVQRGSCHSV